MSESISGTFESAPSVAVKKKELEEMIDDHWDCVSSICERMYKDAFRHGYGHGWEDAKEEESE